jgi:ABC-2 type transport system ATP-binding protein
VANAIEVVDLRKSYGSFEAVKGVSFTVETGKVFAFLGPNGAGKTTTTEILEGYRDRTSGEVRVLGFDPIKRDRAMRSRIGIVLQECGFPKFATVRELLDLQGAYYPTHRPVDEVLELVGLDEKAGAVVKTLSGGQQRRLDLGLALIGNPDLIFLDEPTTGFDPNARREAWDAIANLRNLGKTIFLTTHYMDEAQALADHVAVIAGGLIVAEGPPSTLGGRDTAATHITFANDGVELPALSDATVDVSVGTVRVTTQAPTAVLHELTRWAVSRNVELHQLNVSQPTLEDVYLQLTATTDAIDTAEGVKS